MPKPTQSKSKKAPAEATAVVEGEQASSLPADPVAVVQREVGGLIKPNVVYRPAPNDAVPADIAQGTWGHAESYGADGASHSGRLRGLLFTGARIWSPQA